MLPSLFISHGSPAIAIMNNEFSQFFKDLKNEFEEPKYIIIVSAHWQSKDLRILSHENAEIIYDFYGFPQALYEKKYEIKNDLKKVKEIKELLKNKNIDIKEDSLKEGYDHGVWVPLSFMYPKAHIPVIQISLPFSYSSYELYALGQALEVLRKDSLIIGSGNITHNLNDIHYDINASVKDYASTFRDYIIKNIREKRTEELLDFQNKAPKLKQNHPSLEHFMPLFFALGASKTKNVKVLNNTFMHGNLAMDSLVFQ